LVRAVWYKIFRKKAENIGILVSATDPPTPGNSMLYIFLMKAPENRIDVVRSLAVEDKALEVQLPEHNSVPFSRNTVF
jgi:hypothetical protein